MWLARYLCLHLHCSTHRYFAEASAHMACMVFGVRPGVAPCGAPTRDYWITDGLYGSMNCLLYDHAVLNARALQPSLPWGSRTLGVPSVPAPATLPSTVFGPTCDGLDVVLRDVPLPEMENGDWLVFPRMGAYTLCGAANFNGINSTSPSVFYVDSGA
jgi:ornithine decarboxylase